MQIDDNRVAHDGQDDHDQPDLINLGYLAEVLLASEESWANLPDPFPLFGAEFLDAVLAGAGDGN